MLDINLDSVPWSSGESTSKWEGGPILQPKQNVRVCNRPDDPNFDLKMQGGGHSPRSAFMKYRYLELLLLLQGCQLEF